MTIALKNVNLIVDDLAAARRFYVDVLGLVVDERRSHDPGFVFLHAGDGAISLQDAKLAHETAGAGAGMEIGFEIDEEAFERISTALKLEPQTMGWGRAMSLRDPAGHRVNVFVPKRRW